MYEYDQLNPNMNNTQMKNQFTRKNNINLDFCRLCLLRCLYIVRSHGDMHITHELIKLITVVHIM